MEKAKTELTPTAECVETLIRKAAEAGEPVKAMNYSQAALNAAKAVAELANLPPK